MEPSAVFVRDRILLKTVGNTVPFLLAARPPIQAARMHLLTSGSDWAAFEYAGPHEALEAMRLYESCGIILTPLHPEGHLALDEIDERIHQSSTQGLLALA